MNNETFIKQYWMKNIQIMVCSLFGTKPLPEPTMTCCQRDHLKPLELESKYKLFSYENTLENVSWAI